MKKITARTRNKVSEAEKFVERRRNLDKPTETLHSAAEFAGLSIIKASDDSVVVLCPDLSAHHAPIRSDDCVIRLENGVPVISCRQVHSVEKLDANNRFLKRCATQWLRERCAFRRWEGSEY